MQDEHCKRRSRPPLPQEPLPSLKQPITFRSGSALLTLIGELAGRRINSRLNDVVEHFTNRLRDLGEEKIDREWFTSEQFQTLLFEALRQLQVTHDSAKLKMLGVGLANSGAEGFKEEERKDLFIRFVRELTSQHVGVLLKLLPETFPLSKTVVRSERPASTEEWEHSLSWSRRPTLTPRNDGDLFAVQMLHAYGLVEEEIKSSIKEPHLSNISNAGQARSGQKVIPPQRAWARFRKLHGAAEADDTSRRPP
jgi:hypothetical protein